MRAAEPAAGRVVSHEYLTANQKEKSIISPRCTAPRSLCLDAWASMKNDGVHHMPTENLQLFPTVRLFRKSLVRCSLVRSLGGHARGEPRTNPFQPCVTKNDGRKKNSVFAKRCNSREASEPMDPEKRVKSVSNFIAFH